jgi:hypothetical protein
MLAPDTRTSAREAAAISKVERMIAVAPEPDLWAMERVRRRLAAHEDELRRTWPSPRRTELNRMIARDIELLCEAYVKLETALERTPSA